LRWYRLTHRHPELFFFGNKPLQFSQAKTLHKDKDGTRKAIKIFENLWSISKNVHIDTLRHSIEADCSLRTIQVLLGLASPVTTALYNWRWMGKRGKF
jgi:site-specific recombinase XerD